MNDYIGKVKVKVKSLSRVRLSVTPWTAASQDPPPLGFSRQEYWSGLPFPSLGDLPDSGIEPGFPALQVDTLPSKLPGKPWYILEKQFIKTGTQRKKIKIALYILNYQT